MEFGRNRINSGCGIGRELKKFFTLVPQPPPPMLTAQEVKKAWDDLDTQIAVAEQEAKEARLWAKEEAWVATKKARLEEEVWEHKRTLEMAHQAKEAWVWAAEEAQKQEEERRV